VVDLFNAASTPQALYSCTSSNQCKYQGCDGYCDPSLRCWTWTTNGSKWCQDQPPNLGAPSSNQTIVPPAIVVTHVVRLSLSLPLSMVEFNHTRRAKFLESIARAAGASPADVTIDNVKAIFSSARDFPVNYSGVNNTTAAAWNRRDLSSSIRIDVSVMATDKAAADAIVARLTYHNINAELAKAGFPRAEVVVKPFTQSLSADRMSPFPIAPIIGGTVGGVVLIGMAFAYCWCWRWRQRNTSQTSGQQSAVPRPSESARVTVQAPAMRPRRPPSAPPPAAPWSPPPTPPPAPSAPSLSAAVPLPFAATSARAAPSTRPWSQSQPENVIMGDVYDPSLSEMRAWQQQPVEQEETLRETGCFQEGEETVRDRMPSGPPLHPAPPSSPPPPQLPEAPRKRECVVCYDKEPSMAMIPCGHVCACVDCAELLRECPMCRALVLEARRIYLL
jgi:hypothetical protein